MQTDRLDQDFLLKNLMNNTSDIIYFKDRQSRFIMVNEAFVHKHKLANATDSIGKTDFDLFSAEHARQAYEDEQRILKTGEPMHAAEEKETWSDGHETWVSTIKMPLRDENHEIIGTFGISRDITERKLSRLRAQRFAEQMKSIKEAMEEDVHMAGELQKTFFPRAYPEFRGAGGGSCVEFLHRYNLCRPVGGDYCSIKRVSEHEAAIFLCDVGGIGVRAALGTALVRGIMQEISVLARDPGEYLSRMNELLLPLVHHQEQLLDVKACYLVLDVKTGMMKSACAGHPIPIHLQYGSSAKCLFENLVFRGPKLASATGARYTTIESKLEPGDAVVLFTDGLVGALNGMHEPFGEKRLLDSAQSLVGEPLGEVFEALEGDVLSFSHDCRFSDDVCLVGVQLNETMGGK